jgi:hypothetical protein
MEVHPMRILIATLMLCCAQQAFAGQPAQEEPGNAAVNTTATAQPDAPVKGANSFTEGQAAERIKEKGFSDVAGLMKDNDGIWRGKAKKDGKDVDVSLDFQGNVFPNSTAGEKK